MARYISLAEYRSKKKWCEVRGWTEPFFQDNKWYAFPPNAVIPLRIPKTWYDYRSFISGLFLFLAYRVLTLVIIYTILKLTT